MIKYLQLLILVTTETPIPTTSAVTYQWTDKDYLVSPTGRDDSSLSGKKNDFHENISIILTGSETEPWQTLSFAVQRLRQIRNSNNPPSQTNSATIHITGDTHHVTSTVALDRRDGFLTIKNYQGEQVKLSGGVALNISWSQESNNVVSGQYQGQCGELYIGDYRMMRARSPNIGEYGVNTHYTTGPYHRVAGYLVETDDCKLETNWFSQKNCPEENKNGFYLTDEMSPDWADLDQTQILFYHSWINEYARY